MSRRDFIETIEIAIAESQKKITLIQTSCHMSQKLVLEIERRNIARAKGESMLQKRKGKFVWNNCGCRF
jgi:hypothetical protein